ncbi:MAG TPA: hypothetical protein VGF08_07335 [Terriglobales bacterium]|jgi:hypothetical protein
MLRINKLILGLTALAVFCLGTALYVQPTAAKPMLDAGSSSKDIKIWVDKGDGVQIAQIPRFIKDANEPEFAILRLSVDKYKEFQKDPLAFLNHIPTFSQPIKKANKCSDCEYSPKSDSKDPSDPYFIVIGHWPGSKAIYQIYPGEEPNDDH